MTVEVSAMENLSLSSDLNSNTEVEGDSLKLKFYSLESPNNSLRSQNLSGSGLQDRVKDLVENPESATPNNDQPGALRVNIADEHKQKGVNEYQDVLNCEVSFIPGKQSSLPSDGVRSIVLRPVPKPRTSMGSLPIPGHSQSLPLPAGLSRSIPLPAGLSQHGAAQNSFSTGNGLLPAVLSEYRTTPTETPVTSVRANQESNTMHGAEGSLVPQAPPRPSLALRQSKLQEDERMFKLRNYQVEISENIMNYLNDIIILPTGTGKTPVAINAIRKQLLMPGSKTKKVKILFLTPRVVLAEQQLDVIKSHLPLQWADRCTKLTGGDIDSMDALQKVLTGDEYAVMVATPQTVFNYFLAFETSSMKQFSMIIFDEVHNANGGDPYNRLLHQYMDEKFFNKNSRTHMPQLIGLTASVGLGDAKSESAAMDYILSFCSKLDLVQHPADVIKFKEELEAIRNPPVEEHRKVEHSRADPFSTFIKQTVMKEIISDVEHKIRTNRSLRSVPFRPPRDIMSQGFEQKCVAAENQFSELHDACQNDMARDCVISIKHLRVYHLALKWANLARLSDAMKYMDTELSKPELSGNKFADKYKNAWQSALKELADGEEDYPNEKLVVLKEELDKAMSPDNCRDGEIPRIMVFVEYRRLAYMIADWLNSIGPKYKVERFVSRLASPGDYGMPPEESRTVMSKFRSGELNILVATSVLSEGVDIPECNGTIRYMYMKDVIAEVQVPGRMRAWGGRVVAIVNEKLYEAYLTNKTKERLMAKALEKVRKIPLDEFLEKMAADQERDYKARLAEKKRKSMVGGKGGGGGKPGIAQINCKQCGRRLGQLSDIHRYLEAHYIILAKDVLDNVEVSEGLEYRGVLRDGMADVGILVCMDKNCNAELGRLINIKISNHTRKLGVWDINKVRLAGSTGNFAKWEDVAKNYGIEDIKQEKLRAKIDSGHFIDLARR